MSLFKHIALTAVLICSFTQPAQAEQNLPSNINVSGSNLQLNGIGTRTRFFIDVYKAGLYVPSRTQSAGPILNGSLRPLEMRLIITSSFVDKDAIQSAIDEGFQTSAGSAGYQDIKADIDALTALFPDDLGQGTQIAFTANADGTTSVSINETPQGSIGNSVFQRALLAIWLGQSPADEGLKAGLLGG